MTRHDKSIQDREKEDGANELEDFLADCGDGTVTVKVTRLDPPHGYCGEFFVTKSTPLTMQQIQKRFGGRVFQLNTRSSNGKIRKQKTVQIDDVPKREGYEILPDGSTERPNDPENPKKQNEHPLAVLAGLGIPPHIMEQLTPWALGYGMPQQKQDKQGVDFEAIRQQSLLNMMNMQMKQSIEFQREMMALKREAETQNHPRNPYSDMEMIFKMLREMKGFQSEIGGGETNLASEALQGTMDLVSNGLSEYLALKKLQAQSEIAKGNLMQSAPRELPSRRQPAVHGTQPRALDAPKDPIDIARQMGAMFRSLDPEQQQLALNAFLGDSSENLENIENTPDYDTILEGEDNPLDAEDQEILNGANPNEIEADHIQDGQYTGSADADDQADRAGD